MLVKIFPHGLSQPVKKGAKVLLGNFRPGEASARDARPDLPVLSPRLFPLHTRVAGIPGCGACLCVHQRHTPDALYRGHHCAGWVTAEFSTTPLTYVLHPESRQGTVLYMVTDRAQDVPS